MKIKCNHDKTFYGMKDSRCIKCGFLFNQGVKEKEPVNHHTHCMKCHKGLSAESGVGGEYHYCSNQLCERYGLYVAWNLPGFVLEKKL